MKGVWTNRGGRDTSKKFSHLKIGPLAIGYMEGILCISVFRPHVEYGLIIEGLDWALFIGR